MLISRADFSVAPACLQEGLLAPVFASGALFGCYLLLKYFPDISLQVGRCPAGDAAHTPAYVCPGELPFQA